MSNKLLVTINGRITKLQASERVTKVELSALSREVLEYTLEQWDSQVLNRTAEVLTAKNQKALILFFQHYTPFAFDKETGLFSGIKGKKAKETSIARIQTYLETGGEFWEWVSRNTTTEKAPVNYTGAIEKNIKQALKKNVSKTEILQAIFAGGVSSDDVIQALESIAVQSEIEALETVVEADQAEAQAA